EPLDPYLLGNAHVVARKDRRRDRLGALDAGGADEAGTGRAVLPGVEEVGPGGGRRRFHRAVRELAEDPRCLSMIPRVVPDEPARREGHRVRAGKVVSRVAVLVGVIVRVRLVAPLMPERALVARRVVVVEQDELLRERMNVRRHRSAEDRERWI